MLDKVKVYFPPEVVRIWLWAKNSEAECLQLYPQPYTPKSQKALKSCKS